jgi:hypothetical protein
MVVLNGSNIFSLFSCKSGLFANISDGALVWRFGFLWIRRTKKISGMVFVSMALFRFGRNNFFLV